VKVTLAVVLIDQDRRIDKLRIIVFDLPTCEFDGMSLMQTNSQFQLSHEADIEVLPLLTKVINSIRGLVRCKSIHRDSPIDLMKQADHSLSSATRASFMRYMPFRDLWHVELLVHVAKSRTQE
jgi:hypothetical protein